MSHQRAKRILMKWERFHTRYPRSGKLTIGTERYHLGHLRAYARVAEVGRAAPNGIRDPFRLHIPWTGA